MTLSSVTSLGFGLVIQISLPLIHTIRNYNNYQTEVRRILITLINVYNSLTNLHTPQIAATRYHFSPLHQLLLFIFIISYIATDGRSISKSWCRAPLLFDSYGLVFVGRPL
jgi:hypothetical protein